MSRKTSLYSRKRRPGYTFNGAEWLNVAQRCRTYSTDGVIPGIEGTSPAVIKAETLVRDALNTLLDHARPLDPERNFDILSHALGVSVIRSLQIQPDESENPALPILKAGSDALVRAIDRYQDAGAWGMDGPGRQQLIDAIDVYAEILRNSSPAQMAQATERRMQILNGRTRASVDGEAAS